MSWYTLPGTQSRLENATALVHSAGGTCVCHGLAHCGCKNTELRNEYTYTHIKINILLFLPKKHAEGCAGGRHHATQSCDVRGCRLEAPPWRSGQLHTCVTYVASFCALRPVRVSHC